MPPDLAVDERVAAIGGGRARLLAPGDAARDAMSAAEVVFHLAAADSVPGSSSPPLTGSVLA